MAVSSEVKSNVIAGGVVIFTVGVGVGGGDLPLIVDIGLVCLFFYGLTIRDDDQMNATRKFYEQRETDEQREAEHLEYLKYLEERETDVRDPANDWRGGS